MAAALTLLQKSGAAQQNKPAPAAGEKKRRVLVLSESPLPSDPKTHPMLRVLAKLRNYDVQTVALSLTEPDQDLSDAVLAQTDVLVWWGEGWRENKQLSKFDGKDATVERVMKRASESGMGVVLLHQPNFAKPLTAVLGLSGGAWGLHIGVCT